MKTKNSIFSKLFCALSLLYAAQAQADIRLKFQRTGTDAQSTKVIISDENGNPLTGATATLTSSHEFTPTKGSINQSIICPNVNGNTQPQIELSFDIKGLTKPYTYKTIGIDIHAFNASGNYQGVSSKPGRQYNVKASAGKTGEQANEFGQLNNIDIAYKVVESGNAHKVWNISNTQGATTSENYTLTLDITAGQVNNGCFLGISEIILSEKEDSTEVTPTPPTPQPSEGLPFALSQSVGIANACYNISNKEGQHLMLGKEGTLSWAAPDYSEEQSWYFVNDENVKESYLIVNAKQHQVYSPKDATQKGWSLIFNTADKGFSFIPTDTKENMSTILTVDGISEFYFNRARNTFAINNCIYERPCGTFHGNYITSLSITGDLIKSLHYPLSIIEGNQVIQPSLGQPGNEYILYTKDRATIAANKNIEVKLQLNTTPLAGMEGFLYFDWNRDGIFETTYPIDLAQTSTIKVAVPDVKNGTARMRIRLTENGMKDADQEVIGQILDCMVNLQQNSADQYALTVEANEDNRGTVAANITSGYNVEAEATATPKGNSQFVCWRETRNILSAEKNYKFTLNHDTHLVAVFTPNTDTSSTGIEQNLAEKNEIVQVTTENKWIKIETSAKIQKVMVFTINGQVIAQSDNATVNLAGAPAGTYVVKVFTQTADKTAKVLLK